MKKFFLMLFTISIFILSLIGCSKSNEENLKDDKINIITTSFPYYDFAKEIGGEKVNVNMLIPAGSNTHSFEPVASDIIAIEKCDIFIYNGGEQEKWVNMMLKSINAENIVKLSMIDNINLLEEETVEGMTNSEHNHSDEEIEFDEHIWTSPINAIKISEIITSSLKEKDKDNSQYYQNNFENYKNELIKLDKAFRQVVENSKRKFIVVGDKFPLRYFTYEYGLSYTAAFSGCGNETEPSAKELAYIIDKVKNENIPIVYYIENSSQKVADTICNATGAKKLLFHSCHNVTKTELENGATYISLMEQNIENLKKGLE